MVVIKVVLCAFLQYSLTGEWVCRLVGTNLRRKSAHALIFGGDFELKIPREFLSQICATNLYRFSLHHIPMYCVSQLWAFPSYGYCLNLLTCLALGPVALITATPATMKAIQEHENTACTQIRDKPHPQIRTSVKDSRVWNPYAM